MHQTAPSELHAPQTDGPSENVLRAWTRLVRAEQVVLARVEDNLKRAGFPPLEWYDVLLQLDRAADGVLPQGVVQSRMLVAQYNLCRLVDRLEREDLVLRQPSPDDGRSNRLVITGKGRALRAAMWPVYSGAIEAHFGSRLTCPEAGMLAGLLDQITGRDGSPAAE